MKFLSLFKLYMSHIPRLHQIPHKNKIIHKSFMRVDLWAHQKLLLSYFPLQVRKLSLFSLRNKDT